MYTIQTEILSTVEIILAVLFVAAIIAICFFTRNVSLVKNK